MTTKPLVTLDLDNTLWPVMPVIREADRLMHAWLGARFSAWGADGGEVLLASRRRLWQARTDLHHDLSALRRAILRDALATLGASSADVDRLGDGALAVFMDARQRVVLYPGAEAMLADLARDCRLVALSNGNADVFRMPIGRHFSASFSSAHAGFAKPHPRMFELALAHAGRARGVHVGDHPEQDVAAAQALGWRGVWVNHAGEDWSHADVVPDAVVTHLDALAAQVRALLD